MCYCQSHSLKSHYDTKEAFLPPHPINQTLLIQFNRGHPVVLQFKSKTKCLKVTIKTQQQCINISILLWQHILVFLDHLQASIQRYVVQSVHIMYYGIPYYLQGVHKK